MVFSLLFKTLRSGAKEILSLNRNNVSFLAYSMAWVLSTNIEEGGDEPIISQEGGQMGWIITKTLLRTKTNTLDAVQGQIHK